MTLLSIDWGSIGIKTLQFILSFSILVTLHELGHFVTARWFKCRVKNFTYSSTRGLAFGRKG